MAELKNKKIRVRPLLNVGGGGGVNLKNQNAFLRFLV